MLRFLRPVHKTPRVTRLLSLSMRSASTIVSQQQQIIFQNPHEKVHLPQDQTIWHILEKQVYKNPDKTALICGVKHEQVTFEQLYLRARQIVAGLVQKGLIKGDVVLLNSFNCPEYPMVFFALTSMGAICSPSSPLFVPHELAVQIKASEAKFVMTHQLLEKVAIEAAQIAGLSKDKVLTIGKSADKDVVSINDFFEIPEQNLMDLPRNNDPNAVNALPFSSGTTGVPKGVQLTAANLMANCIQISHVERFKKNFLGMLPFFHIYGLLLMHMGIYQGVSPVILPKFEPELFLNALEKYQIEKAHIAPPVALFLANHPLVDKFDLSNTKYVISGGAPMGKEVEALVTKRLQIQVKQAYGMTEASPAVNYTEDHARKPGSVGRLVPMTELRVVCTKTGKDLEANTPGELLYRGPQVMPGYLKNEVATKKTLTDCGFLRTGDIGFIDEEGYVFILDRVKELIKYKGHQIAPAELEDVLNHHPKVLDSCCVRSWDESREEIPKAFVVLKDPSSNTIAEEILDFVATRVAPYKKIRSLEFIDAIPKSATGKILRRHLQSIENAKKP